MSKPDLKCKSNKYVVKDSGERQDFETGAQRDMQSGKPRFDLIPLGPLRRLADLYSAGAEKYGPNNWRKGIPLQRTLASLERHLADWIEGKIDEDHGAAVLWNMMALMWTEDEIAASGLPTELDDLVDRIRED
ncbi:hypothetical protein LCGC14_0630710 [marine sediment metagenome]|uniref:dATP/dGTP diphosphohydrolase N-terminal domain-containing protein n=1 Tax=marine sediment metagenome TaxID=412755 RepID=A0A0F9R799_9ZZZZ